MPARKADEAMARMGETPESVEAGQQISPTRDGRAVAYVPSATPPKNPLPLRELAEFRASMPRLRRPFVSLLRAMRDECP